MCACAHVAVHVRVRAPSARQGGGDHLECRSSVSGVYLGCISRGTSKRSPPPQRLRSPSRERRSSVAGCPATQRSGSAAVPGAAARSSQQETSAAAGSTVIESGDPPTTIGLLWLGAPSSCSVSARLYCPACINGLSSRTQLCSRSAEHTTSYVRSSATMGDGPLPHGGDAQANLSSPFACFCRWLGSGFLTASVPRSRSRAETEPFTGAVLSRVALSLS